MNRKLIIKFKMRERERGGERMKYNEVREMKEKNEIKK